MERGFAPSSGCFSDLKTVPRFVIFGSIAAAAAAAAALLLLLACNFLLPRCSRGCCMFEKKKLGHFFPRIYVHLLTCYSSVLVCIYLDTRRRISPSFDPSPLHDERNGQEGRGGKTQQIYRTTTSFTYQVGIFPFFPVGTASICSTLSEGNSIGVAIIRCRTHHVNS